MCRACGDCPFTVASMMRSCLGRKSVKVVVADLVEGSTAVPGEILLSRTASRSALKVPMSSSRCSGVPEGCRSLCRCHRPLRSWRLRGLHTLQPTNQGLRRSTRRRSCWGRPRTGLPASRRLVTSDADLTRSTTSGAWRCGVAPCRR